ncbi:MAG TPA: hypothetical protein VHW73_04750 [Rudaea sp.]|jgi:hypothetical protein|nr:hypothetical protein [Rudaea sp.]
MDKRDFEKKYRPHLRVAFDWDAFEADEWTLEEIQLALPRDAHKIWTPWPTPPGRVASHSLGKTLSLLEVAEDPTLAGDEQDTLFKHEDELVDGVAIDAPAFALSGGRILLLDRNHRVAAATILKRTSILELVVISGPSLQLLPDIARVDA